VTLLRDHLNDTIAAGGPANARAIEFALCLD
jgi:hypothetical protein